MIISKLATSLSRRDEVPNKELAELIVKRHDQQAVKELVLNLKNKNKNIQSDCIKTLYEIGERKPELLSPHIKSFTELLDHSNNRMVWGGMSALARIVPHEPRVVYKFLPQIMDAADKGTVITKDNAVRILISLAAIKSYKEDAVALLLDQLRNSAVNQLPMYAENAIAVMDKHKEVFIKILLSRLKDIEKETGKKRVQKVIMKLKG